MNGHTFSVSEGVPTRVFTLPALQLPFMKDTNRDYVRSAGQPWSSMNDNGNVTLTGEPTEATKAVRLHLASKIGAGNILRWTVGLMAAQRACCITTLLSGA